MGLELVPNATNISDETGTALAAAVKENAVLQSLELWLSFTNISDETGTALAAAVKENAVLQSLKLGLSGTDISREMRQILDACTAEVVKRNRQLRSHWIAVVCFVRHAVCQ